MHCPTYLPFAHLFVIALFQSRIARFKALAKRIVRFDAILKSAQNSKAFTVIRTVFGLAIRIVRFEITANRWQPESLRTANRDSRHLSPKLFGPSFAGPTFLRNSRQTSRREFQKKHLQKAVDVWTEWPISRDTGSDAMCAKHGNGDAMRCKNLAMRVLAAQILCDALPRCENTSDAMPRCRPLS